MVKRQNDKEVKLNAIGFNEFELYFYGMLLLLILNDGG